MTADNVLSLLYTAKKYAVSGLAAKCSTYLENNIDKDNAPVIFEQVFFQLIKKKNNNY